MLQHIVTTIAASISNGIQMAAPFLLAVGEPTDWSTSLWHRVVDASAFALIGVAILFVCVWIVDKVMPFSFRKEIVEDQNTALAILVSAILIGIALIIAAAVQG